MSLSSRHVNLVLSGGGIKGIAYVGAVEVLRQQGIHFMNIAGVSAGALMGAFLGAGYKNHELKRILGEFDFQSIQINEIPKKVPAVANFINYERETGIYSEKAIDSFLRSDYQAIPVGVRSREMDFFDYRGNLLKNIITLSKQGCLYDGDVLEEWVYHTLLKKGIRTFGDLKGGAADKNNPHGYRVRMTAVDASRGKTVILPDDISFYGIEPDQLEVAKAVRMSTSVPFAFKPVEMKVTEEKRIRVNNLVDGGVFDNFPLWLFDNHSATPVIGFRLDGGRKKSLFNFNTPLQIMKGLVSAVQDIGVPENYEKTEFIGKIDTSKVLFMDFSLSEDEKHYLYKAGKYAAYTFLSHFGLKSYRQRLLSTFGQIWRKGF